MYDHLTPDPCFSAVWTSVAGDPREATLLEVLLKSIVFDNLLTASRCVVTAHLQLCQQTIDCPVGRLDIQFAAHNAGRFPLSSIVRLYARIAKEATTFLTLHGLIKDLETNATADQIGHVVELLFGYLFDCSIVSRENNLLLSCCLRLNDPYIHQV